MQLTDLIRETDDARGIKCYDLGALRDAYLATHPELERTRGSKDLYADLRRELSEMGATIWPLELKNSKQENKVYLISNLGKVGVVLHFLNEQPPSEGAAQLLRRLLDTPPPPADG